MRQRDSIHRLKSMSICHCQGGGDNHSATSVVFSVASLLFTAEYPHAIMPSCTLNDDRSRRDRERERETLRPYVRILLFQRQVSTTNAFNE